MDPNLNRQAMGSRAGTSLKAKFGAGGGQNARLGTAAKGLNPLGVGTTVQVKERPLTTGGGIIGPVGVTTVRKVYDRNYYVNKVKEKQMQIHEETEKLTNKAEQINKEQQLYNKLESRVEELSTQVRNLQGQLADYNLALDKLRINTRPEDVKNAYVHVKTQNQKLRGQLDQIFLDRKKVQEQTDEIKSEVQNIHQQMELRLNQLDPHQRNQYQALIAENNELINQHGQKQRAMEDLLNRLANAQNKLRMDSQKLKGQLLKDQIADLQTKKTDYEIQLNEANLSIPEARDRILARMKEDNLIIGNMQKRMKDVKKYIDIYEKKLRELQENLEDKKTQEEDKRKYQILYQRDKEMDQFLNSFDKIRSNEINQLARLEANINNILEHTAKVLQISNQLPTGGNNFTRTDKGSNTIAQAKTEYELRLNNLRALENAEKRTETETNELSINIEKMKEQIKEKFDKVENVKDELNRKKNQLLNDEKQLQKLKEKINPNVNSSDYQSNIAQKKYQMHDTYSSYSAAEKKLHQMEGQRYYLRYYINTKSKDITYEDIKNQCMSYAEQLNKSLLK